MSTAITAEEKAAIDAYLARKGLNKYGDAPGTMYAGGNPCFDMRTGEMKDRHEYLVEKFPERPWNAAEHS